MPHLDPQIISEEDERWHELWATVNAFTSEQLMEPGYFEESWTAKDAIAHVGTWLAEAGAALEQLGSGTYVALDATQIDAMNLRFLAAMRDASIADVKAQAVAARARLLHVWADTAPDDETATAWIRKSGPDHYREHLSRLKTWLGELQARSSD